MYHQLASKNEVMKRDKLVLEKKYKRSQQKIKQYDQELKMTRQQVSTFKIKFRGLMDFIQKKGGITVLSKLPNLAGLPGSPNDLLSYNQQRELNDMVGASDLRASAPL
mmetsp:Transcript_9004/g.15235  ORF Transcript_9004/g.15235 Transcript_9004/m.15235 type:complete len:108 (-) Transcript_9004:247-570(-)